MMGMLRGVWRYRYFILTSIINEFKSGFARSRLGGVWMVLNPLAQVAIFAFILSAVLSAKLPGIDNKYAYSIYLMSGMLFWSLFSEIISRNTNLFISNAHLLKKLNFPRITLPLIIVGSCLVNNLFLLMAMIAIFALLGHTPGLALFWLFPVMLLTVILAAGLGLFFGVLNVFVRDVSQLIPVVLQLSFWFTPIVYMAEIIPAEYISWLDYSPTYHMALAYQNIVLYDRAPDMASLLYVMAWGFVSLALSFFVFRRANDEMADML